jgi:hypothetical protein
MLGMVKRMVCTATPGTRGGISVALLAALLAVARTCYASAPTLDDVHAMQAAVEQGGLTGFAGARQTNGWQAPVMPSAWYVSAVSPATDIAYYNATRDLGSALLTAVDAWAQAMQTDDANAALAKATTLIDLAYWLGGTEGYANLILGGHARDVAVTGLARRVADLSVPLLDTTTQLERCRAPFDAAPVRARVLNFEAGSAVFPTGATVTDGALARVWAPRDLTRTLAQLDQLPTPGATPDEVSSTVQQLRAFVAAAGVTPQPTQASDVFFRDDTVPPPQTTRATWASKQHQRLLVSPMPQNVDSLELLVQFRTVVGAFPTQPQVRQEAASAPGEEAFADAWRPHIGTATTNLGRGAWGVYDRIQRGVFVDADTSRTRLVLARTPVADTPTAGPTLTGSVGTTPTPGP